ncbi:MAG: 3-deoxy-D-manno-octulosonic acid transferase [Rhodobacteraceae bacterium]|nr:MAG: 3-deoxy-D-manno-octulosonic acid transferase [Paracoccaceae bacterium]
MSAPPPGAPTFLLRAYRAAMAALQPLAFRVVARKLRRHGVDEARIRERLGHATLPRPEGDVVWFHGASVGESLAMLSLIDAMLARRPDLSVLVTSGTATSAEVMARRLPPRARHQFAPLDTPAAVTRFLDHWRPRAGLFVESELWPNMLMMARARGVRLALVNARLSRKSIEGWSRYPGTARTVLGQFDLIVTQNRDGATDLARMGAPGDRLRAGVNLKSFAARLPADAALLEGLRHAIGTRPLWVASSTHDGEEDAILDAHLGILRRHPEALLILAPRHPDRAGAVEGLIRARGLTAARRGVGALPGPETQVYLADTLGEMGLWYALSPIVFLGGSLREVGGHNPYEPALFGAAIASGPHVANFSETYDAMARLGAVAILGDATAIAAQVTRWLQDDAARAKAGEAARAFADRGQAALEGLVDDLVATLLAGPA